MKKYLASLFILMFAVMPLHAKTKNEKIIDLLKMINTQENARIAIDSMAVQMRDYFTNLPENFFEEFKSDENTAILLDLTAKIYDKYYTEADIDAMVEFYKTPLGKKLLEKTPLIMKDSFAAGAEWGKMVQQKVQKKLNDGGFMK